jgi:hypothetical protein
MAPTNRQTDRQTVLHEGAFSGTIHVKMKPIYFLGVECQDIVDRKMCHHIVDKVL